MRYLLGMLKGYKDLRQHFGFDKGENRIYEALIARITLSFFAYLLNFSCSY